MRMGLFTNQNGCWSCRFWSRQTDQNGHCRKARPLIGKDGMAVWPTTGINDWCGRYNRVDLYELRARWAHLSTSEPPRCIPSPLD